MSRRVLETLTFLARSHPFVAKLFFQFSLPPLIQESSNIDLTRGKAVMVVDEDENEKQQQQEEYLSIKLLLSLLNQPLYLRSIAHLEQVLIVLLSTANIGHNCYQCLTHLFAMHFLLQLLNLFDVIIDNAESKPISSDEPGPSATEQVSGQIATLDAELNTGSGGTSSGADVKSSKADEAPKLSVRGSETELDYDNILRNLPQAELRLLCSLLAREGYVSDASMLYAIVFSVSVYQVSLFNTLLFTSMLSFG